MRLGKGLMVEACFEMAGGAPEGGDAGGGGTTGPALTRDAPARSAPPDVGEVSPEAIRALLSGISKPPARSVLEPPSSPSPVIGGVELPNVHHVLPGVIARAANARVPFSLVMARPGQTTAERAQPRAPTVGQLADLAAALSVSLAPDQELFEAGDHHLALLVPGRATVARRRMLRLERRASEADAPVFSWAAARYPGDAVNGVDLVDLARRRLDGGRESRAGARSSAAEDPVRGRHGWAAVVWAGVAAAVLVGACALVVRGTGTPSSHTVSGVGISSAQPGYATVGGSGAPIGSGSNSSGSTNSASDAGSSPWAGAGAQGASGQSSSSKNSSSVSGGTTGNGQVPSGSTGVSAGSGAGSDQGSGSGGSSPASPSGTTGTSTQGTGSSVSGGTTSSGVSLGTDTLGTSTGVGSTGPGSAGTGTAGSTTATPGLGQVSGSTPSSGGTDCTGLVSGVACAVQSLLG